MGGALSQGKAHNRALGKKGAQQINKGRVLTIPLCARRFVTFLCSGIFMSLNDFSITGRSRCSLHTMEVFFLFFLA